jgi:hypothetical protein
MKKADRSFKNVAKLKYLGATVTDTYLIHEEIKNRLNSDNALYHSVQNLLFSRLLPKNLKIIKYPIQNYNFICSFIRMRSLIFGSKERTYTEGVREQNAAENIRPEEG